MFHFDDGDSAKAQSVIVKSLAITGGYTVDNRRIDFQHRGIGNREGSHSQQLCDR